VPPHWLPYVFVDDPDATLAKAKKLGATVQFGRKTSPASAASVCSPTRPPPCSRS
jgi:hypothetical protein